MPYDSEIRFTTGTLQPGGVFMGIDGVKIDARRSGLDEPLEVFIERVEDTSELEPLNPGLTAVTPYYRLEATERYREQKDMLLIRLPLPEGVSPEGLAVFFLVPGSRLIHTVGDPDAPDLWASRPVDFFADANEIAFSYYTLLPEGTLFTIVFGAYRP